LPFGEKLEVDFAFWFRRERIFAEFDEPILVLAEAKASLKKRSDTLWTQLGLQPSIAPA
jgi:hypothetical protein